MKSTYKLKRRKDGRLQRKVTMTNNITGEKIIKMAYGYTTQELDADADRLRAQGDAPSWHAEAKADTERRKAESAERVARYEGDAP